MIREDVRKAISDAYYEARNNGHTMEQAADTATDAVLALGEHIEVTVQTSAALGELVTGEEGRAATFTEVADAFDTWAVRYLDDPEGDWLDVGVVGYGPACARYLFDLLDERAPEYEPIDAADTELAAGEVEPVDEQDTPGSAPADG